MRCRLNTLEARQGIRAAIDAFAPNECLTAPVLSQIRRQNYCR